MLSRLTFQTSLGVMLVVGSGVSTRMQAQDFAYSPGTSRYRMVVKSSGVSEVQGAKREVGLDAEERMTLTLIPRGRDTLALSITLDSARVVAPNMGTVDATPAVGMQVSAVLSSLGRVYSRELPNMRGREAFTLVAEEMARFLPMLPASLRIGLSWTDTLSEPVNQLGIAITRTRITSYRVLGDTALDGERAWRVQRSALTSMVGEGTAMGTPMSYEGTSVGTGMLFLSQSGRYLGADLQEEVKSKVTLAAMKQEILGTQTQKTTVTLLR
jgi:hypothetical protein